ncbi:MAG: hypothetical protein ABSH33_14545 [Steroidobacteraceae bacterium]|jgi:general stress protein CsbA
MGKTNSQRLSRGAAAVLMAAAFNHFGDRILGVKIEAFSGGIGYFSPFWVLDLFLVPFLAGMLVSLVFGFGGKWLSCLPPLIVRTGSYVAIDHHWTAIAPGSSLMPAGWWGLYVILAVEAAAIGGVIGEVMIKRTYGRSAPQKVADPIRPIQR